MRGGAIQLPSKSKMSIRVIPVAVPMTPKIEKAIVATTPQTIAPSQWIPSKPSTITPTIAIAAGTAMLAINPSRPGIETARGGRPPIVSVATLGSDAPTLSSDSARRERGGVASPAEAESVGRGSAVPAGEMQSDGSQTRSPAEPLRPLRASKLVCSQALASPLRAARPRTTSPAISRTTFPSPGVGVSLVTSAAASSVGRCFARSPGRSSSCEALGGARKHQRRWRRSWSKGSAARRASVAREGSFR